VPDQRSGARVVQDDQVLWREAHLLPEESVSAASPFPVADQEVPGQDDQAGRQEPPEESVSAASPCQEDEREEPDLDEAEAHPDLVPLPEAHQEAADLLLREDDLPQVRSEEASLVPAQDVPEESAEAGLP